jgi:hypothetical protein
MSQTLLILANTLACVIVIWHALCAVSKMDSHTHWSIRWAFVLLATGAFATLCMPPTSWAQGAALGGLALVLIANRRERCGDCSGCLKSRRQMVLHDWRNTQ